ncbi:hypothetical protein [Niastella sp. OAS944]|uniref:hypothetical protein n=1 Tax=Niastella sp. OAS944 TaxID=2664089 RepID=UPI0035C8191F|nr:hypothetical protein [Chitinophagaceae bacterium OAS944]
MENKKQKHDPNKDVHSEFETSVGNDNKTVREETLQKERGEDGPLNQLNDEDPVKNEQDAGDEPPKMKADPDAL